MGGCKMDHRHGIGNCNYEFSAYPDDHYVSVETPNGNWLPLISSDGENNILENPKDAQLIATAPTLLKQHIWNKVCRDAADKLLAEAGFEEDSSIRNALSSMNFDGIEKATK